MYLNNRNFGSASLYRNVLFILSGIQSAEYYGTWCEALSPGGRKLKKLGPRNNGDIKERFGLDLREYCESGQMRVKVWGSRQELSNAIVQGSGGSIFVWDKIDKGRKSRTLNLVSMTFSKISKISRMKVLRLGMTDVGSASLYRFIVLVLAGIQSVARADGNMLRT